MKRKKQKTLLMILLIGLPNIVHAEKYIKCGEDKLFPYPLVNLVSIFFTIIKIAVPILLVISGMIAFLKVTFSSNVDDEMKKAKSKLVNNIIAAVIIFFVISIVNFAVGLVAGSQNQFMSCVNCFINPDRCTSVEKENELTPGIIGGDNNQSNSTNNNTSTNNTNSQTPSTNEDKTLNNFIFVGDSRYNGIRKELQSLGKNIRVEAEDSTGPTVWLNRVSTFANSSNKISIMLGVNEPDPNKMIQLLNKIHELNPNVKIYVSSVYHIGKAYKSGYITNQDIDKYNSSIKAYCDANSWLTYIDITNGLYETSGYLKASYTKDGLHMNDKGNKILINNLKKELTK